MIRSFFFLIYRRRSNVFFKIENFNVSKTCARARDCRSWKVYHTILIAFSMSKLNDRATRRVLNNIISMFSIWYSYESSSKLFNFDVLIYETFICDSKNENEIINISLNFCIQKCCNVSTMINLFENSHINIFLTRSTKLRFNDSNLT